MIRYSQLKNNLLKAVSMSKTRVGLVQVIRMVSVNGTTFPRAYYVRPDQVKATDRVIAGHQNLPQGHPQRPAVVRSAGSTAPLPNSIKQATDQLWQQCGQDVNKFYQVLNNLGITWTRIPNRPGTDLMRAKMALNNAQANGLDLSTYPTKLLGLNNPVTATPPPAPTLQPQQPAAQTPPQPAAPVAPQPATSAVTLPPKAAKAGSAAKQAASAFAASFSDKQDFYDALTQMGITWKVNKHPGINNMWAISALAQHIENGFDPSAALTALKNGNVATQPAAPPPTRSTSTCCYRG